MWERTALTDFEGVVLGFDFGEVRVGVALGNGLTRSARALRILDARTNKKWDAVASLIKEWEPSILVVGVPRHPDGAAHEVTQRALKFARSLRGRFHLPVYVVDERYSSVEAQSHCQSEDAIDDEAACIILQQWFDEGCPQRRPEDCI